MGSSSNGVARHAMAGQVMVWSGRGSRFGAIDGRGGLNASSILAASATGAARRGTARSGEA